MIPRLTKSKVTQIKNHQSSDHSKNGCFLSNDVGMELRLSFFVKYLIVVSFLSRFTCLTYSMHLCCGHNIILSSCVSLDVFPDYRLIPMCMNLKDRGLNTDRLSTFKKLLCGDGFLFASSSFLIYLFYIQHTSQQLCNIQNGGVFFFLLE
ncbi:hypothetical protein BC941DRAFT_238062 [Chlamydoabsidia padenii]|nr:hypothetical protein BC941DRAFT_238062 [Chlamydoabsidia padenii]